MGILEHVPPLLGIAEVNAADIDRVLIGTEPIRERNQMGHSVRADRCQPAHCLLGRYAISASEKTLIQELLAPVSVLTHPLILPVATSSAASGGAGSGEVCDDEVNSVAFTIAEASC